METSRHYGYFAGFYTFKSNSATHYMDYVMQKETCSFCQYAPVIAFLVVAILIDIYGKATNPIYLALQLLYGLSYLTTSITQYNTKNLKLYSLVLGIMLAVVIRFYINFGTTI